MDVRIGVIQAPKEIEVELPDDTDREALSTMIEEALSSEDKVLWFTDRKGRQVAVPASKVAYVEIGSAHDERKFGFGAQ